MATSNDYSPTIFGWHISDALTAAGLTACLALLGVTFASLVTLWLAKRQREFEMRRTVYLDAALAIATGQTMIGSMLDLTVTNERIRDGIEGAFGALAKVNVTGRIQTIQAVGAYAKKLTEATQRLWIGRTYLQTIDVRLSDLNAQQRSYEADLQRLSNLLQSIPPATSATTAALYGSDVAKVTYQSIQLHQAQIVALNSDREALLAMKLEQIRQWSDEALIFVRKLQALIPAALVAARREMHLRVNAKKISAVFDDLAAHGEQTARQTIASVDAVFAPLSVSGAGNTPGASEGTERGAGDASGGSA